jgi:hypothetical protein
MTRRICLTALALSLFAAAAPQHQAKAQVPVLGKLVGPGGNYNGYGQGAYRGYGPGYNYSGFGNGPYGYGSGSTYHFAADGGYGYRSGTYSDGYGTVGDYRNGYIPLLNNNGVWGASY